MSGSGSFVGAERMFQGVFGPGRRFSAVMIAVGLGFLAGGGVSRHEGACALKDCFNAVRKLGEV